MSSFDGLPWEVAELIRIQECGHSSNTTVAKRRSCDRCYAIKERCQVESNSGTCHRCERLGHKCKTARPVRPVGRRPRSALIAQNHERTITPDNQSEDAGHDIEYAPLALHVDFAQILEIEMRVAGHKLPPAENAIIEFLLDKQQFIRHFVIGPSFSEGMRLSLQSRLVASPGLLIEGFLACSGELGRKCGQLDLEDHVSMSRCSKAVQKLRSRNLRDLSEAPGVLALGTSILTYDHLALMNTGPLICRYTLSQIEPWYLQLSRMPEMDFELNCLVYIDIFHCLLHREIPVLRPKIRDSKVVDRYIGVCYTLLPLLYDICNVASKLKGTNSIEEVDTISRLHVLVANWQPTLPDDFASRYTTYEVVAMISQANIYRQVALLILHRLRYKFGNEDLVQSRIQNLF